jgi:hypothetical protein
LFAGRTVASVNSEVSNLAFHNLTPPGTTILDGLRRLLGLNLKFCPTPKIKMDEMLSNWNHFIRNIRLRFLFKDKDEQVINWKMYIPNPNFQPPFAPAIVEATLKNVFESASSKLKSFQQCKQFNLSSEQRTLLGELKENYDLFVLQADKNLGPVLMTKQQYLEFCLNHLNQPQYYKRIKEAPIKELIWMIRTLHAKVIRLIHQDELEMKYAKHIVYNIGDTKLGRFYALAKIHKTPLQLRPIVASCGTPTFGLSKWLDYILQPYVQKTTTFVQDSESFRREIMELELLQGDRIFTLDVVALYTNTKTAKALKNISTMIYKNPLRKLIIQGLHIVMNHNYFELGDTFWKQTNGTAMGTPVAPTYASLFLAYHEQNTLLPTFQDNIRFYRRYIDDGFMIWRNTTGQPYAWNRFKAMLKCTTELEWTITEYTQDQSVPFLDLELHLEYGRFYTTTFEKKLNLYLYTAANSAHPSGVLKGLIFSLVKKYRLQNTKDKDFFLIVNRLLHRLHDRGYDGNLLKPLFKQALQSIDSKKPDETSKMFIKIPFNPNGPSRIQLRHILELPRLQVLLQRYLSVDQIQFCFLKPKNLRDILLSARVNCEQDPTPKSVALALMRD